MAKINYEEAIKKPFTDIAKLIIGIVLSIVPGLWWVAKGLILECSGVGKTKPSKKMPELKNWWNLFVKGFASDFILVIYAIPAGLVFLVVIGMTISSLAESILPMTGSVDTLSQLISQNWYLVMPIILQLAPVMLFGFVLLLIAFYLTPIAVLNYLKTKKFSEAFNLNRVTKKAFTSDYFVTWIIALVITGVITWIILLIFSAFPYVGKQIAFFITGVISYSLYGQIYRKVK